MRGRAPAARGNHMHQRQAQLVAVELDGFAQLPGGAGRVVHTAQQGAAEGLGRTWGLSVGICFRRERSRAARRPAGGRLPGGRALRLWASARPWWSPRTRRCCLRVDASASTICRTSPGKQAWSPVYSTTSTGCVMDAAVLARLALDDRPGPGREPAFGRALPRKADGAVVGGKGVLAPQRAELALGRVQRQVEAAQVAVGAPDVDDGRVAGQAFVVYRGGLAFGLDAAARAQAAFDQSLGGRIDARHACALRGAVARDEFRRIARGAGPGMASLAAAQRVKPRHRPTARRLSATEGSMQFISSATGLGAGLWNTMPSGARHIQFGELRGFAARCFGDGGRPGKAACWA